MRAAVGGNSHDSSLTLLHSQPPLALGNARGWSCHNAKEVRLPSDPMRRSLFPPHVATSQCSADLVCVPQGGRAPRNHNVGVC